MGREIFRITGPNTAEIDLPYNAAHPSRAAKAVAKMAWLMLSPDQRLKHHGISAWLAGGSACENTRCQLFTTDIVVGQTQLVLFDARVCWRLGNPARRRAR